MFESRLITGDCRTVLPQLAAEGLRVQTCITSPPYYRLRDYGMPGQIGCESCMVDYLDTLVGVFRLVRDILADDGTLWLNLGDSYAARGGDLRAKNLLGIPWRLALALQYDGWYLRQDIIWHKTNPLPEPVTDRCVGAHEYLFLLAKQPRYYFDHRAIQEPSLTYPQSKNNRRNDFARAEGKRAQVVLPGRGVVPQHRADRLPTAVKPERNKRDVWSLATRPTGHAHVAAMPTTLVEPCILAGSRPGDIVLDPFSGSGTVIDVANRLEREWLAIEIDPAFAPLHEDRTVQRPLPLLQTHAPERRHTLITAERMT